MKQRRLLMSNGIIIQIRLEDAQCYDILVTRYNRLESKRKCIPPHRLWLYYDILAWQSANRDEIVYFNITQNFECKPAEIIFL